MNTGVQWNSKKKLNLVLEGERYSAISGQFIVLFQREVVFLCQLDFICVFLCTISVYCMHLLLIVAYIVAGLPSCKRKFTYMKS